MSDVMPKFENTQSFLENTTASNVNYNSTITNTNYGRVSNKLNFA